MKRPTDEESVGLDRVTERERVTREEPGRLDQQQQQGVPPIIMQQVQPAAMQAVMQSQQPWIILQHSASPLVQVTQQPSFVISHLHMPIVMLQQHTIMPFIMQQQLTMPPAIILQRFCIMAQAAMSVQVQVIFMPPAHFSNFMVQRGTIIIPGAIVFVGIPMPPVVGVVVVADVIGFIIAVTMRSSGASCVFESVGGVVRLDTGDHNLPWRLRNYDTTAVRFKTAPDGRELQIAIGLVGVWSEVMMRMCFRI